ncbi:MAG: sugar ABC transporter ATP-binding protein [Planctomycetota bacterium]
MSSAAAPALEVCGVAVRYPGASSDALSGVDLAVQAGEIHALIGQNGAGKSTLLHVLGGVFPPTRGAVRLRGLAFAPRGPADARRRGIALIHQELALVPHLSVEANVLLGLEPMRGLFLDRRRARQRVREALGALGRVDVPVAARVRDLPPAARQLVEIARALALGADVLLLDEPTSSLGRAEIEPLFALLHRLRAQGKALVYISHAIDEVRAVASSCTVLRDGAVVLRGSLADTSDGQIITAMVGRDVSTLFPRGDRRPGEVVLRVRPPAGETLEVRRGEILGLAGLVGAGRTELLRGLVGLDELDLSVEFGGVRCAPRPPAMWRRGVGIVSEDRKSEGLALRATIADNVTLPRLDLVARGPLLSLRQRDKATRALIDRLGIRCLGPRQAVRALSGGNQQKVALARLLFSGSHVLLLDEPTRGIDVGAKAEVYRLLDDLVTGQADPSRPRAAVLLVSSYLPELLGLCDRIAVIRRGRLEPARDVADLDEASLLASAIGAHA